jgi:hypothetical protein
MTAIGEFITALVPLLSLLISGTPVGAAVSAITFAQWIAIGIKGAEAGPAVMAAMPKIIQALDPAFDALKPVFEQFIADVFKDDGGPTKAAANIRAWVSANATTAIELQPGISNQ